MMLLLHIMVLTMKINHGACLHAIHTGGKESFRFRRRSASDAYEKGNGVGPRSPRPPNDV